MSYEIPKSALPQCVICKSRIPLDDREMLEEVTGFSKRRKGGGQNHVKHRRTTGRFMCGPCDVLQSLKQDTLV